MSFPNVDLNLRWQDQNVVKKDGQWTVDGASATPPHTHAGAAVVATVIRGHVLNQMVHSHVDPKTGETHSHDSGAKVYGPGESWYEAPGCHHVRSETVGDEEAVFVANLIVSTDTFKGLDIKARSAEDDLAKIMRVVIIDKEVEEQKAAAEKH
ncbi:hypothetical protein ACHAPT_008861 [Fusarium lateritium]